MEADEVHQTLQMISSVSSHRLEGLSTKLAPGLQAAASGKKQLLPVLPPAAAAAAAAGKLPPVWPPAAAGKLTVCAGSSAAAPFRPLWSAAFAGRHACLVAGRGLGFKEGCSNSLGRAKGVKSAAIGVVVCLHCLPSSRGDSGAAAVPVSEHGGCSGSFSVAPAVK